MRLWFVLALHRSWFARRADVRALFACRRIRSPDSLLGRTGPGHAEALRHPRRHWMAGTALLLLLGLILPTTATAQGEGLPTRVLISYQHMGWDMIEESFVLERLAGRQDYTLQGSYEDRNGGRKRVQRDVDAAAVTALVEAVREPAWDRGRGVRGVAARYRRGQLIPSGDWETFPPNGCSKAAQRLVGAQYVKNMGVLALVDDLYGNGMSWTDDYPFAVIQLIWADGRRQVLYSDSQKALMLPWRLGEPGNAHGSATENWSIPISEHLRALLPTNSFLHARLDGVEAMARKIGYRVEHAVQLQCSADLEKREARK